MLAFLIGIGKLFEVLNQDQSYKDQEHSVKYILSKSVKIYNRVVINSGLNFISFEISNSSSSSESKPKVI